MWLIKTDENGNYTCQTAVVIISMPNFDTSLKYVIVW